MYCRAKALGGEKLINTQSISNIFLYKYEFCSTFDVAANFFK